MTERRFPPRKKTIDPNKYWKIWLSEISDYRKDFDLLDRVGNEYPLNERIRVSTAGCPTIENVFSNLQTNATVVDLLATDDSVRSIKQSRPDIMGISVSLDPPDYPSIRRFNDPNIHHIQGNINKGKTWQALNELTKDRNLSLLMERGYGGLNYISTNLRTYKIFAQKIWNLLPVGAVAILQIPPKNVLDKRGIDMTTWLNLLDNAQVPYRYASSYTAASDNFNEYGLLMLQKTNTSLPSL